MKLKNSSVAALCILMLVFSCTICPTTATTVDLAEEEYKSSLEYLAFITEDYIPLPMCDISSDDTRITSDNTQLSESPLVSSVYGTLIFSIAVNSYTLNVYDKSDSGIANTKKIFVMKGNQQMYYLASLTELSKEQSRGSSKFKDLVIDQLRQGTVSVQIGYRSEPIPESTTSHGNDGSFYYTNLVSHTDTRGHITYDIVYKKDVGSKKLTVYLYKNDKCVEETSLGDVPV